MNPPSLSPSLPHQAGLVGRHPRGGAGRVAGFMRERQILPVSAVRATLENNLGASDLVVFVVAVTRARARSAALAHASHPPEEAVAGGDVERRSGAQHGSFKRIRLPFAAPVVAAHKLNVKGNI